MGNLIYLLFLIPVFLANLGERDRRWRTLSLALLGAIDLVILATAALALLAGIVARAAPEGFPPTLGETNWPAVAAIALAVSILAALALVPGVRRWLARWVPIDPDSIVHTTALSFAVYQVGASLGQPALLGNLDALLGPEFTVGVAEVLLNGAWLTLLALFGVGMLLRRSPGQTAVRLGLNRPTWRQALAAAGLLGLLMALSVGINVVWQQVDPASFDRLERITRNLYGALDGVGGAVLIGVIAGVSEELLFRGAVQPRFGLVVTSLLFAVSHLQYGFSLAALQVFVIGLALGVLRNRTGTTLCILVHAAYNMLTVLVG